MKIASLLFVSLLFVFLCGCRRDPLAEQYVRTEPSPKQLLGEYTGSFHNIDFSVHPKLILHEGTFELTDMPVESLGSLFGDRNLGARFSGTGKWEIRLSVMKIYEVAFEMTVLSGEKVNFYYSLPIVNQDGVFKIAKFIGDPDSNHIILFEK